MKQFVTSLMLCLLLISFIGSQATESIGDTLVVGGLGSGDEPLNVVIEGDTTATGERVHSVYRLKRDGWYELSGTMNSPDFALTVVAEAGEGRRPVLLMGLNESGAAAGWQFLNAGGDVMFKDIRIQQIHSALDARSPWGHAFMFSNGPGARIVFDNCIIDFNDGAFIMNEGAGPSNQVYKFTDCMWRWNGHWDGGAWNGFGPLLKNNKQDSVIYENCTWTGGIAPIFTFETGEIGYFKMNHCTIVDHMQFLMRYEFWTNAEITNNLFINAHVAGENEVQAAGQGFDGLPYGVITVDSIPTDSAFMTFPPEADRRMIVKNNCNFVDPDIKDWWGQAETDYADQGWMYADWTQYNGFLNSRALGMFNDNETWPMLELENLWTEDPGFADYPDNSDILIQWGKAYQDTAEARPEDFNADPDGNVLQPTDVDVYDLSYSNETYLTGATDGFPMGDLNWFPDKKAQWEAWLTGVETEKAETLPVNFELAQNFPNPFNPSTTIEYTMLNKGQVDLAVYNLIGQKVKTLVDDVQLAGRYTVQWNGMNEQNQPVSSGVYIYKITTAFNTQCKKMMLVR